MGDGVIEMGQTLAVPAIVIAQFIPGVDVIVDGIIFVGSAAIAAGMIVNALQQSKAHLKDHAQDKPCADCGEVGCFNTPEGGDPNELERQLKEQQDAINKESPDDILDRMDKFDQEGRPDDSAARQAARDDAANEAAERAHEEALNRGMSPEAAEAEADSAREQALAGKDATHALDWVAGGKGEISGVADSKINRSVGSQWTKKAPGSDTSRREDLRRAAEAAKKAGKKKMDVKLKKC